MAASNREELTLFRDVIVTPDESDSLLNIVITLAIHLAEDKLQKIYRLTSSYLCKIATYHDTGKAKDSNLKAHPALIRFITT